MKCNICEANTWIINDEQQYKEYFICENCQTIYLSDKYLVSSSEEKKQYENHNNNFESPGYVRMFEDFIDFFWQELPKAPKSALDFGSGPGPVLVEILRQRGVKVDSYDKFFQPEKIYEGKKYDLITCTEVLEHISNPKEILTLFKDHLKPGGIIAVMTLFHKNNTKDFLNWWYRRDPTHITFYTPRSFEVLADMCGLKIVKHDDKRILILTSLE